MNETLILSHMPDRTGIRPKRPKVRYFAYGPNMNPEQIRERCSSPVAVGPARLPDHALAFHGYSWLWDGGMETVLPEPGHDIWGVVYELGSTDADSLDAWQGIRLNGTGTYFHSPVTVFTPEGVGIDAVLYKKDLLGPPRLPSNAFLEFIRRGAAESGLPWAYVDELGALPCAPTCYDLPRSRDAVEDSIRSTSCADCWSLLDADGNLKEGAFDGEK